MNLTRDLLRLVASFINDAQTYVVFTRRTAYWIQQLFLNDERVHLFVALHLAKFLGVGENYLTYEKVNVKYAKKFHEGFKRTGFRLIDFFDQDNVHAATFLQFNVKDNIIAIRAKLAIELAPNARALTMTSSLVDVPRKHGKTLGTG